MDVFFWRFTAGTTLKDITAKPCRQVVPFQPLASSCHVEFLHWIAEIINASPWNKFVYFSLSICLIPVAHQRCPVPSRSFLLPCPHPNHLTTCSELYIGQLRLQMHHFGVFRDVHLHLQRNSKNDHQPKNSATVSKGRYPVMYSYQTRDDTKFSGLGQVALALRTFHTSSIGGGRGASGNQ